MSTRLEKRRARLRAEYGFDFPEDFFRFWEFANRLSPLQPLEALDPLGLRLVGPFEVLAGRFDGRVPRHSLLLHWRYHDDPPEFFTVLAGGGDGLHWGYYLDDPETGAGCIASYYTHDVYELSADGDTLFEAVRLHLEYEERDQPDYQDDPEAVREELARFRRRLLEYATADRPEIGAEYTDRYEGTATRQDAVVAETMEGLGIVVPESTYRPLTLPDRALWRYLRRTRDPMDLVEEGRQALREGFPGTALKLGKDLWATEGEPRTSYAYELLDAAYAALGRERLRVVLQTHRENRTLPSVDILDEETPEP